jgi:DNA excision repair protein ERCC-4
LKEAASTTMRIEALEEKLHAKLAEKWGQRPTDPNVVSKRATRRAEKKKRQEEAAKRKKSAHTQAEKDNNSKSKQFKMAANNPNNSAADIATLDFGRLNNSTKSGNDYQNANKSLANMGKSKNLQKLLADAKTKKQQLEDL